MKKQILDALKAKFIGVSESILSRIADKLAKTVLKEDDVAAAIEGVTFNQVLENYGDSRATEAQQTAVSTYEKKHGLKDGQKVHGGEPTVTEPTIEPKGNDDDTPAWAKTLIESNKTLSDKLAALEGEKVTSTRKGQLTKLIEKLPAELQKPYTRMAIDKLTDEEFTSLTSEITTEVESISSTIAAKGAVFGRPSSSNRKPQTGKEPSANEVDDVAKQLNL